MKSRLACLICILVPALFAQDRDPDFVATIWKESVKVEKIAVPDFQLDSEKPAFRQAWETMMKVLKDDLGNSGVFYVLGKDRTDLIKSPHGGPIDFEGWGSIEADHLVVGDILEREGRMRVEIRLYEVRTKRYILAKAYNGRPDLSRKMAHTIADEIMYQIRGIRFANSKLIFTRESMNGNPPRPSKELYIMDYDGYNPLPITRGGISFAPTATRVGENTALAYCTFEKAGTVDAYYSISYKPSLLSRPISLFKEAGRRASSPAISPDGKKIAFSMANEGNVDIHVMNLDGSDFLRLTRHPGVDTNPFWLPGGNALMFTSDRTGSPQVFKMDADGLNKARLTYQNPYNDSAVWNPVHDYIAFVSRFENDFDIFIMNIKSGELYRVTEKQGSNEDPTWSPDGEQLAFSSNRTGSWQIYVVNLNGKNLRQVTFSGDNRSPVWVPGE